MQREFTTIETPISKEKVVLKSWLTGREKRAITSVYLNEAFFKGEKGEVEIKGDLVNKAQDETIKTVIVSIGEIKDAEKILNYLLDMRNEDYKFVMDKINELTKEKNEEGLKK